MKKLSIILGVVLASISVSPTQASEPKSLAIIDSYFDNSVSVSQTVCVSAIGCQNTITVKPKSLSDPANHGNAMVEVAKRQNPNVSIIAIRSANTYGKTVNEMNAGDFVRALSWVNANPSGIGAVSVSRFFNGNAKCSPNSAGTAEFGGVALVDSKIKELIASLKQKGIPVFAATGNKRGAAVDYPACIVDTNSVGVGAVNKSLMIVSAYSFDANTDFFASTNVSSYKSPLFKLIPNTTSAGTVAVATKYLLGLVDGKFVGVVQ